MTVLPKMTGFYDNLSFYLLTKCNVFCKLSVPFFVVKTVRSLMNMYNECFYSSFFFKILELYLSTIWIQNNEFIDV